MVVMSCMSSARGGLYCFNRYTAKDKFRFSRARKIRCVISVSSSSFRPNPDGLGVGITGKADLFGRRNPTRIWKAEPRCHGLKDPGGMADLNSKIVKLSDAPGSERVPL